MSDGNGRFGIPYIPAKRISLHMYVTVGAGAERRTGKFFMDLDPDREKDPIEVTLVR